MLDNLQNLEIKDIMEILFLSGSIYYFSLWLKKDKEKNLILPFYAYWTLFFISYYADIKIITASLIIFAPVALIMFILLHQETLQKNFIMLKKVKSPKSENNNWQEELIQSCLYALNKNKELVFLIEKDDNLETLTQTQFKFFADFKKDLFELILEKQICSTNYMIWLNKSGKLVAINTTWNINHDIEWVDQEAKNISQWKQDAILITSKTDAIVFKVSPIIRSFDIVIAGKIAENLSPEQLFKILENNLNNINTKEKNITVTINSVAKDIATKQQKTIN